MNMLARVLVPLVVLAAVLLVPSLCQDISPYTDKNCRTDVPYPPSDTKVSTFVLNLDLAPKDRWAPLAKSFANEIQFLIDDIISLIGVVVKDKDKVVSILDDIFGPLAYTLPQPYQDEIIGIAEAAGMSVGQIVIYNIFYELNPFCTSIVAEDTNGTLYHARNLDFGIFLGWNVTTKQWTVAERLRKVVVNVDYQKGGKTLAKAVHFAGYVGVLSGVRLNMLTMTMNARKSSDPGFLGFLQWVIGQRSQRWMGFFVRDILMGATDYASAKNAVMSAKVMSPAYIIMGGNKTGEGAVVIVDRDKPAYAEELDPKNGKWFVLQTNYDPMNKPPFFDDRRTSGLKCMTSTTQKDVGFKSIYNVLSTKPNLNLLTTYTAMMQVNTGYLETFLRQCPQPCYPW